MRSLISQQEPKISILNIDQLLSDEVNAAYVCMTSEQVGQKTNRHALRDDHLRRTYLERA